MIRSYYLLFDMYSVTPPEHDVVVMILDGVEACFLHHILERVLVVHLHVLEVDPVGTNLQSEEEL